MRKYQLILSPPNGPLGWWVMLPALASCIALYLWIVAGTQSSWSALLDGLPWIADFVGRMLPPNLNYIADRLWQPAIQTVQIALLGTFFSIIMAVPLSFLAAKNLSPNPATYHLSRQVLNLSRGINEIILALIFVAAVGLGPFAGVLALAVHGAGMVGKFFAEAIEDIDRGAVEAMEAASCSKPKIILFAILPQVMPMWIGTILYRLEANIRISTILGMVGAGGIGFELMTTMKLFEYENTAACVLVILCLVFGADILSSKLRSMIK
ncbi:phosphonate transport system permease protein [Sinobacterium caligoides]|uniref:Phosphonate transport system permease protein n=1 Tax=Sinobacterium caligoides TaxID=933926 RepID=A0A3N2DQK6_9GAMM|nr:phosphonate ABC transporter, permease protein PhnE [Sinobacterium caligoides]ROS02067.1 phosphonate transport system permease protein [Sinobacterium caligoides]